MAAVRKNTLAYTIRQSSALSFSLRLTKRFLANRRGMLHNATDGNWTIYQSNPVGIS